METTSLLIDFQYVTFILKSKIRNIIMLLLAHLEDLLHVSWLKPGLIVNSHDVYLRTIKLFFWSGFV